MWWSHILLFLNTHSAPTFVLSFPCLAFPCLAIPYIAFLFLHHSFILFALPLSFLSFPFLSFPFLSFPFLSFSSPPLLSSLSFNSTGLYQHLSSKACSPLGSYCLRPFLPPTLCLLCCIFHFTFTCPSLSLLLLLLLLLPPLHATVCHFQLYFCTFKPVLKYILP